MGFALGESSGSRRAERPLTFRPTHPTFPSDLRKVADPAFSPGRIRGFRTAYSDELASDFHGIPRYVRRFSFPTDSLKASAKVLRNGSDWQGPNVPKPFGSAQQEIHVKRSAIRQ